MAIQTGYTKRLGKVGNYFKNVGKSVGYAAIDVLGELSPTTKEFKETNEELFKQIYSATKNYKQTLKAAEVNIRSSKIYSTGDAALKALKEDIRTGQFYNKTRQTEMELKATGDDFSDFDDFGSFEDFNFNDDDDDFNNDLNPKQEAADNNRATFIAKSVDSSIKASAQMTSTTVARSTEFAIAASRQNTKILYAQGQQVLGSITTGFSMVKIGLDGILETLRGPLQTHMENSKTFYEATTAIHRENNALLKELVEIQRKVNNPKNYERKQSAYDDIVGSQGTPDLKAYSKQLLKNIKSAFPDLEMILGDSFGDKSNLLLAFAGSPLKFLPELLVKTVIPATVRSSVAAIDNGLSTLFSTLIARANRMKKQDGLLGYIGKIFGLSVNTKTSVDTSKYNRDNMSWNGIAQKTLVDVIPTYLRKIEAALTGGEERLFDYNGGKWKKASDVKKEYDSMKESAFKDATSEVRDIAVNAIKELKAETYAQQKDMIERVDKLMKAIYTEGGGLKFEKRNQDAKDDAIYSHREIIGDDNLYEYLMKVLSLPKNRKALRELDGNIISAKQNLANRFMDIEENGGHLLSIFDNSMNFSEKNKSGKLKTPGVIDKYGHDALFYLRNILGEVMYIRKNPTTSGAGRGRKRGRNASINPSNVNMEAFMNDNITKSDIIISQQKEKERKYKDEENRSNNYKGGYFNLESSNAVYFTEATLRSMIETENKNKKKKEDEVEKPVFLDQLLQAGTFGEKLKVLGRGVKGLKNKPATWLNSIITKADQRLFDFFFDTKALGLDADAEDNRSTKEKAKGFLDMIINKTKDTFDKLNDYIDKHILEPLKTKFMPLWEELKEKAKPYKEAIKNKFKWAGGKVKGAVSRAFSPLFSGGIVNSDTIANSAHGRYVEDYGLTMVSPGEIIIPSSPDKRVQNKQLLNEIKEKNKIIDYIKKGKIAHNASGNIDEASKEENKENTSEDTIINKAKEKITEAIDNAVGKITGSISDNKQNKNKTNLKDSAIGMASRISGASKEKVEEMMNTVQKEAPDVVANTVLGGTLGILVGGPLFGAALGAATGIVSKSKTLQGFLFGTEEKDDGLISQDFQKKFKKILPDLETYGITGAVAGIITPFGPVGGLLVGSALAVAKNNESFMEKMFGKEENGVRDDSGYIKPDTIAKIKKAAPKMVVGSIASMMLGPFGLIGNIMLGSGIGLASTTDKFKEFIFGKENGEGEREGGLVGSIKKYVIEPLKNSAEYIGNSLKEFVTNELLTPFKKFLDPVTQMMKNMMNNIKDGISDGLNWFFEKTFGRPLNEMIENITRKVTGAISKVVMGALAVPKAIIKAPFQLLAGIGNNIRTSQINKGTAHDMTAAERLAFRAQHNWRSGFSKWTGADKTLELDTMMANMSGDRLDALYDSVGQYVDRDKWSDTRRRDTINRTGEGIVTFLNENKGADGRSLYDTIGYKGSIKIRKAMATGDAEAFRAALASTKGKGGRGLSNEQQQQLFAKFQKDIGDIKNYGNMQGQAARSREELLAEMEQITGKKMNAKTIKLLYRNLGREVKANKDGIREAEFENEDMAKLSGTLQANANATADRMIDTFTTTNKILKIIAEHMTGEKVNIKGLEGSGKGEELVKNITAADKKVEVSQKQSEKVNNIINTSAAATTTKVKSKLEEVFGSDFISGLNNLDAIPSARINKIAALGNVINKDAVDFLIQLEDLEFEKFYKVLRVLNFKLDISTCNKIRNRLTKTTVDLIVKTVKAGYVIKNAADLIGVISNVKNNDQVKLLKQYIKYTGITPQSTSDLIIAISNNNPTIVKQETKEKAAKPASTSIKDSVKNIASSVSSGIKGAIGKAQAMVTDKLKSGEVIDSDDIKHSASGRVVGKYGLTMVSPGEIIIPASSNRAIQNKQLLNEISEKKRIINSIQKGNIAHNAAGTMAVNLRKKDNVAFTIPSPGGKIAKYDEDGEPFDDKSTQEAVKDFELKRKQDEELVESSKSNALGVKNLLSRFFGYGYEKIKKTKEGIFEKIFGEDSFFGTGVGKLLKYFGIGATAVVGVSLTGHLSQYWKTSVLPTIQQDILPAIKEKLNVSFGGLGDKIVDFKDRVLEKLDNIRQGFLGVFDWAADGGFGKLFTNVLFPKLLEGIGYFSENLVAPLTAAVIRALPSIAVGIVKGIKSIFSVSLFNRKLKDGNKIVLDMSPYTKDALAIAENSSTRQKVSSWLGNLTAPKATASDKVIIDISDINSTETERSMNTDSESGALSGIKNFLGLNKSQNKVEYLTDENGNYILDESGNPIRTSDYYVNSANTTIAGQILKASGTATAMTATGLSKGNKLTNLLSNVSLKGAAKTAGKGLVKGNGILGKTTGTIGGVIKGIGSTAGKALSGATRLGTNINNWATGAANLADDSFDDVGKAILNNMDNAASKVADSKGILSTIGKSIKSLFDKLIKDGSLISKISGCIKTVLGKEVGANIITNALNTLADKLITAIGKNAASSALTKIATNLASVTPLGAVVLLWQFGSGMYNAEVIFGVAEPLGWGYKVAAGIIEMINNKITFGLIPSSTIVDLVMEYILPLFNIDNTELQQMRDEAYKELDEWNLENPNEQYDNLEDYLKKDKFTTKVGKALGNAGNWVKEKGSNLLSTAKNATTTVGNAIKSGAQWVGDKVSGVIDAGVDIGSSVLTALKGTFESAIKGKGLIESMKVMPESTGNEIMDKISNAVTIGGKVLLLPVITTANAIGRVAWFLRGLYRMGSYILNPVVDGVKSMFTGIGSRSIDDILDTKIEESEDPYGDAISGVVFNVAKTILTPAVYLAKGVIKIKEFIGEMVGHAKDLGSSLLTNVTGLFQKAYDPSINGFTVFTTSFNGNGKNEMVDNIGAAIFHLSKIPLAVPILMTNVFSKIQYVVGKTIDAAKLLGGSLGTSVGNFFTNATNPDNSLNDIYGTKLVSSGDNVVDTIANPVFEISKIALSVPALIVHGFVKVKGLVGSIIDAAKTTAGSLGNSFLDLWNSATDGNKNIFDVFGTPLQSTGNIVTDIIGNTVFGAGKILMSIPILAVHGVSVVKRKISDTIDAVKSLKDGMDPSDKSKIEKALEGDLSVFDTDYWQNADYSKAGPMGSMINVTSTITKILNAPVAIIKSVFTKISDTFKGIKDWFGDKFGGIWSWITGFFNEDDKEEATGRLEAAASGRNGSGRKKSYGGSRTYQGDPEIADMKFGGGNKFNTIGKAGCGPVAATNLINSMGGNMDVASAANYAVANGYKQTNGGTNMNYFNDILGSNGYSTSNSTSASTVRKSLKSGKQVVMLGNDGTLDGPFGDRNHFITAKGYDNKGNIIVDDPDNPNGSLVYPEKMVLNNMKDSVIVNGLGKRKSKSGSRSNAFGSLTTEQKNILLSKLNELTNAGESGGDYAKVTANDNGSYSVGIQQLHGKSKAGRFFELLAEKLSGSDKQQALSYANMSTRALSSSEASAMRSFLQKSNVEPHSKSIQNALNLEYMNYNISTPLEMYANDELLDPKSIILAGDIANTGNHLPKWRKVHTKASSIESDLENTYNSLSTKSYWANPPASNQRYRKGWLNRIKNTYNALKSWDGKTIDPKYAVSGDLGSLGSVSSSTTSSSENSSTSNTLFNQLANLGTSITKKIFGEDVYNAFFGSTSSSSTSSAETNTTSSGGSISAPSGTLEAFVQTALNEEGYMEKASNKNLDDKTANAGSNNYTKYGQHFGATGPKYPWCAQFVSWAADQANIPSESLQRGASVSGFYNFFKNKGRLKSASTTPSRGDVIIFNRNGSSHTGIVTGVVDGQIKTIEGNTSNKVAQRSYPMGYKTIGGYGDLGLGSATGTTGLSGNSVTTNAFGRRKSNNAYGRRKLSNGFGKIVDVLGNENTDLVLKKNSKYIQQVRKESSDSAKIRSADYIANTGTSRRHSGGSRRSGYGSVTIDYTALLSSIINILISIADNTQVLNKVLTTLSDNLGMKLSSEDIQTVTNSATSTAEAKAKLNTLLQQQKTTSSGVSSLLHNTSTEYIINAMESIASQ